MSPRGITKFTFIIFTCLIFSLGYSQSHRIDSVKKALQTDLPDTSRLKASYLLANLLMKAGDLQEAKKQAFSAKEFAEKINQPKTLGGIYTLLGNIYEQTSDYPTSLKYNKLSLEHYLARNDKAGAAGCYNNIGVIYYNLSDFPKCLEFFQKSLKMVEQLNKQYAIAATIGNIAVIYELLKEDSLSMVYQQKSYNIHEKMGNKADLGASSGNLGNLYRKQKKYEIAKKYFDKALAIYSELQEKEGLIGAYSNLGGYYYEMNDFKEAVNMFHTSEKLAEEMGNKKTLSGVYSQLAGSYLKLNEINKAADYYKKAFDNAKVIGSIKEEKEAADGLYECYVKRSDYKNALRYHVIARQLNDSVFNTTKNESFHSLKTQFALDRQELELKSQAELDHKKQEEEKNRQRVFIYAALGVLVIVIVFSYFLYKRFRLTREQNKVIEMQKEIVEQKNKEITDSIVYAKRLQQAILPHDDYINAHLPENFVFYEPKDIIAGDFYWMDVNSVMGVRGASAETSTPNSELTIIAVADSTGHGVPGALVSVVCSNALHRAVKEFNCTEPGAILDKTRELVVETFLRTSNDVKDGMDISLMMIEKSFADKFHKQQCKVKWSGANNALWYVVDNEMKVITANKQAIGQTDKPVPFTTHEIEYKEGMVFYLFTDGYADQFGGEHGKKYKHKQLQQLILSNSSKQMNEQKQSLASAFQKWKGNLEQVDDVCIIGLRI